jgi:hypothetical protein
MNTRRSSSKKHGTAHIASATASKTKKAKRRLRGRPIFALMTITKQAASVAKRMQLCSCRASGDTRSVAKEALSASSLRRGQNNLRMRVIHLSARKVGFPAIPMEKLITHTVTQNKAL